MYTTYSSMCLFCVVCNVEKRVVYLKITQKICKNYFLKKKKHAFKYLSKIFNIYSYPYRAGTSLGDA